MYRIENYVFPSSLEEACRLLNGDLRGSAVLGGGCWLRLGRRHLRNAVDISRLGLDGIEEKEGWLELGAGVTLRRLETDLAVTGRFGGILGRSVSSIVGVQFRNMVTVGGTVYARLGFSDLITTLLSLDARVVFYRAGEMGLGEYLASNGCPGDILTAVRIPDDGRQAAYESLRRSRTDFPVLAVAVSRLGEDWRVSVGARPFVAARAERAEACLSRGGGADQAGELAAQELRFGSNLRAGEDYRRKLAAVLVRRAAQTLERGGEGCEG